MGRAWNRKRERRRKTREGGALEHCEDNEAKARFLPFQLAPPNDISTDCEIPFGSEESRSIREEKL